MTWLYNDQPLMDPPENVYGFIYIITHSTSGRKYLGRKYFTKAATRTVNKKRIKFRKPSDWVDYYSSSPEILRMIEEEGTSNFKREIVAFGYSRGEVNYLEVRYQHLFGVIEKPEWINSNISSKYYRKNIQKYISQHPENYQLVCPD